MLLVIAVIELYLMTPPVRNYLARRFGVDVRPFMIIWRRSVELHQLQVARNRVLTAVLTVGIALIFVWMVIFYVFIVPSIIGFIGNLAHGKAATAPLIPLIPGVTVKGIFILYFALSASIAIAIHEIMHAVAARNEGVGLKSWGLGVLFIFPLAFVEMDEESYNRSRMSSKLRIVSAGVLSNTVLALIALALINIVLMTSSTAVLIVSVDHGWPAEKAGIASGDIILDINGTKISGIRDLIKVITPYRNTTALFILKVYRPGEGIKYVKVLKPDTYPRLGIRVTETFVSVSDSKVYEDAARLHLFYFLQWLYIINASIAVINAIPLFITDGGRLLHELCMRTGSIGRYLSLAIQSTTAAIVIASIALALITL